MPEPSRPRLAGPSRPLGDPDIPQFHLPADKAGGKAAFAPRLYGAATIVFADKRRGVNETRRVALLAPIEPTSRTIDWDAAASTTLTPADLLKDAPHRAEYLPLPSRAMEMPVFTRWAKSFDRWVARTQRVVVPAPTKNDVKSDAKAEAKADDAAEPITISPKRGGVTVELVAIVWEPV